jgi:iron complex transport system permease protein
MRIPFQLLLIIFLALTLLTSAVSITAGAMPIGAQEAWNTILASLLDSSSTLVDPVQEVVLFELRIPRILTALIVGCILAQSGAVMQGLFRNPLADPGIIGVSSGAAVGAILAIAVLPVAWKVWSVPMLAFLGGLGTTLLVYALARTHRGTSLVILLLAGVAVSAFAGASIGLMSYFADDQSLRELSVWQMGSLAHTELSDIPLLLVAAIVLAGFFQVHAKAFDALLLGESEARHIGINVEVLKGASILLVALGIGICVANTGIIGFVGLVVPHLVRLLAGPGHRTLLPLSALLGALLLLASDLIARSILTPAELPIGLVTALVGAPFFTILLLRERKRWD